MPTLIGDGGHARDIWTTLDHGTLYRINAGPSVWKQVTHHDEYQPDEHDYRVIIGINDQRVRARIAAELGIEDETWIHPLAHIGPDCELGYGTHVYHHASLTRTVTGNHCQISPGAVICGDVILGHRVFVGANATVINLARVPDDTFIRPGTVWTGR